MEFLICDQNTFTLYWNLVLKFYIISVSARTSNTKSSYCIIGDGYIPSIKPPREKVSGTSVLWPDLCSVTFLYGRLQNHLNKAQQLLSSLGFSFPSLHCLKLISPFIYRYFLHSKI